MAIQRLTDSTMPELAAEELRFAQKSLDQITGRFDSDDLLGRIFGSFCIGK
jgi:tRNA modification GTPase